MELDINPNEVQDTCYVSEGDLKHMFKDNTLKFTPWFKLIVNAFLFPWWQELMECKNPSTGCLDAKLLAHREDDKIHRL